jgi:hypothetical protein
MEASIGNLRRNCFARTPVEKVGRRGESFSPELRGKMGMKHNGADSVVDGAYSSFGLAVLLRRIWTR